MAKQLLIYESAVPISAGRHGKTSFAPDANYAFSAAVNAVPLMAVEFLHAAAEYAIVFTAAGEDVLPAAVLGPGHIAQAHQTDEWVALAQLQQVLDLYGQLVKADD